jgi:hypothetical protein
MKLIESKTLGTAQTAIEFTSIPQTFTDLVMVLSLRSTGTNTDGWYDTQLLQNGVSTGISNRQLYGTGSAAASNIPGITGGVYAAHSGMTANTFSNASVYIPNYTSTTNKSFSSDSVTEQNATSALQTINAGLITTSSPITSLGISGAANFAIGSTVSLYGILKGSDGIVTTS